MLKLILLNGLYLSLKWSKDFCLQSPQTSKFILTTRLWGKGCLLTLSDGTQSCMNTPGWGFSFRIVNESWEEKGFLRDERKDLELLYSLGYFCLLRILPMQSDFHIVFFSSPLGGTLFFCTKRKDVVAYRPGGEGACLCCLCCIHLWGL